MRTLHAGFGCLLLLTLLTLLPTSAGAWGERGHDLITQVAIRLVMERMHGDTRLSHPLLTRAGMLGHLSNVPDIVWRAAEAKVIAANAPTHYVALDHLSAKPSLRSLPVDFQAAEIAARNGGKKLTTETGTAPWRVAQLATLFEQELRKLSKAEMSRKPSPKTIEESVNAALLYAGLLSHFLGDLSNPDHSAGSFDGRDRGQAGIHEYFESTLVDAQPLDLPHAVFQEVLRTKPLTTLLQRLPKQKRAEWSGDSLRVAFLLTTDAYSRRETFFEIDRRLAVTSLSEPAPGRRAAARRPAAEVAEGFRPLLIERLAVAADALAHVWINAWRRAGKPDMSRYKSYHYPTAPAFVPVDYSPNSR